MRHAEAEYVRKLHGGDIALTVNRKGEKMIFVTLIESESPDMKGPNRMNYVIEDSRLRMIFAALAEGVKASQ